MFETTFRRLLRQQRRLNQIHNTPEADRSLWDKISFRQRAIAFKAAVGRHFAAFIPIEVRLSPTTKFMHEFNGIHIAGLAKIGDGVTLMQGVTIGRNLSPEREHEAPVVGNNVFIGPGAILIGRCVIGDGAKIGAGVTLVNATIPPGATIVNRSAYDLTNDRWVDGR